MNNVQQKKNHILKNKKTFVKCLLGFNIFRYIPKYFGYKKRVGMNLIHLVWQNNNYIHKSFAYSLRNILLQNREYKMNLMHFFYLFQITLTTRYFGIYRKLANHQKMASKKSDLNFVTEINGKPVDASSHIFLYLDINYFEEPMHIEKVFGIFSMEKNVLLKFKLTAQEYKPDDSEDNGYCILLYISH